MRIDVRKTYKLYIGGKFPRSESGRSYVVTDAKGRFLANASRASRKDARDAVVAARAAFPGWSGATAYNRGQVLYRVAEVMEGRAEQFAGEVAAGEGLRLSQARSIVETTIDRWVWYAGWTDKLAQVVGGTNPVAGPYFNFSIPEPTGIVAVLAPQDSSLLGMVSVLAPALAGGNVVVAVSSQRRPLPAITLAEAFATSDVPAGVVNLLTGGAAEIGPWLADHADVNGIDLTGTAGANEGDHAADVELARDLEYRAAGTLKRVRRPPDFAAKPSSPDWAAEPGLSRMTAFLETKTVWHPIGV
ncbi:MAG: aldehyde dehydrogenase family protein [Geodermatophilaceae bacterium]|jgi:acyl-CoA reductase-like NAD-dependent aldehyde dehydrogenase